MIMSRRCTGTVFHAAREGPLLRPTGCHTDRVIETGNYLRFDRVDAVSETARGLLAELHGEQLRIDLVRDDVVRVKISRGGHFEEEPTFAVCVDPVATPVRFELQRDQERVRLVSAELVVSLWLGPVRPR